ncbi:phage portal protein family protein [Limibacterium fermenti]|uniref:phage portal protein family protein n=1 Tax=Limibacterium fermenti TaxID=3229863 RepID=UPI003A634FF9
MNIRELFRRNKAAGNSNNYNDALKYTLDGNITQDDYQKYMTAEAVLRHYADKSKNDILVQIIKEYQDRNRKDIDKWRQAIGAAENIDNPRWYLIQDLYSDMIDAHLASVTEIRKMATMNHRFYITDKDGKQLDEQTNFINDQWFYEFLNEFFEGNFKKYSVLEFSRDEDTPVFSIIPRRNICPQLGRVYLEVGGDKYLNYHDFPNVVAIIHNSTFGIMNDVIPNLIWKRNALQAYAEYSERFGFPLITAETNNKAEVPKISKSLVNLGQSGTGVLPTGTTITVHDLANAANPDKAFLAQAEYQDNQVGKRFLGSTTITEENGNRAQTEVHERTLDDKLATADKRNVAFIVQRQLMPVLQYLGFPFDNTKMMFRFDETEDLSLTEHWKIVSDAMAHYELDQDVIAETFNLPIIGKKETSHLDSGGISANFR